MQPRSRILSEQPGAGQAPRIAQVSVEMLGEDHIGAMFAGALGGVILTGAIPTALSAAVVAHLTASPGQSGPVRSPPFPGWTYGAVLVVSEPDLVAYRARGEALQEALRGAGLPLVEVLWERLVALGGGEAVLRPPEAPTPMTVRVLQAGDGVGIHSERADWPSMAGVAARLQRGVQLSCYTPLQQSGGGALHLYHRPPRGQEPAIEGRSTEEVAAMLSAFGCSVLRPEVGDVVVFDGGRFNHRVLPAQGGQRWTAGAFLAPGLDGCRYAWS